MPKTDQVDLDKVLTPKMVGTKTFRENMVMRFERSRAALLFLLPPIPITSKTLTLPFSSSPGLSNTDESVISAAASVLRDHRSRSRWNHLRSLYPAGFSPSQAAGVVLRLRNNPRLALRFFLWSDQRRLCLHDLSSYAAIIHVLARSRIRPAALSLIHSAIRSLDSPTNHPGKPPAIFETLVKTYRACDSAPFVFDLLIRVFLDSKKLDLAVQVARLLLSRGIFPLVATSNSLIRSISRARGSDAGIEIYRELFVDAGDGVRARVSPNVQTFNNLLMALYRDGRMDAAAAEEVRGDMEELGCNPNAFTYSILMSGFCDEGRTGEARELWEEMVGKQIKPDIVAFNTLIGGYCNAGDLLSAEQMFREMELSGIEPTCTTFEHLIRGHCRVSDIDTALLVFEDMRRRGHQLEVLRVDELVEELCERGRVVEGLGILRNEMKRKDEGFCPSRKSYELLIGGLCKKGELEEALKLQAEMAGSGFKSASTVYSAFIEAYTKQGDVGTAEKLKDELLGM